MEAKFCPLVARRLLKLKAIAVRHVRVLQQQEGSFPIFLKQAKGENEGRFFIDSIVYLNLCGIPGTSYEQRFIHSFEKFPRRQQLHTHPLIYRLPVDLTVEHIIIQNSLIR